MIKNRIFTAVFSLLALLAHCGAPDIEKAHYLLESGDYRMARQLYAQVLERRPEKSDARFGLGMAYCAEAIDKTELGLAVPSDWYLSVYHVGLAYSQTGGDEERQTMAILLYNLGTAFRRRGEQQKAAAQLENALGFDPELLKALNLLGTIYHESGDFQNARRCYEQAISIQPDYARAHFNLGAAAWALGNFNDAYTSFSRACALEPDNISFRQWQERARVKKNSTDTIQRGTGDD